MRALYHFTHHQTQHNREYIFSKLSLIQDSLSAYNDTPESKANIYITRSAGGVYKFYSLILTDTGNQSVLLGVAVEHMLTEAVITL